MGMFRNLGRGIQELSSEEDDALQDGPECRVLSQLCSNGRGLIIKESNTKVVPKESLLATYMLVIH
jgi:hypothetical protein